MTITQKLSNKLRNVQDFPKKGIAFKDITPILNDAATFTALLDHLEERYKTYNLDFIVGLESRGFILAAALCARLNLGFVPIRKAGKSPFEYVSCEYELEYGSAAIELHKDAFLYKKGAKVLFIDDLIATGGSALASLKLINELECELVEACFIVGLKDLPGEELLSKHCDVYSLLRL